MSKKLKQLIESKFGSVYKFAKNSSIPKSTIYDLTSGKTEVDNIKISVFFEICEELEANPSEIYYALVSLEEDEEEK